MIAVVKLTDGRVLNREMVRAGLAWHFVKYAPNNEVLARLEREARDARRGLWAHDDVVPPWEWRKRATAQAAIREASH